MKDLHMKQILIKNQNLKNLLEARPKSRIMCKNINCGGINIKFNCDQKFSLSKIIALLTFLAPKRSLQMGKKPVSATGAFQPKNGEAKNIPNPGILSSRYR